MDLSKVALGDEELLSWHLGRLGSRKAIQGAIIKACEKEAESQLQAERERIDDLWLAFVSHLPKSEHNHYILELNKAEWFRQALKEGEE